MFLLKTFFEKYQAKYLAWKFLDEIESNISGRKVFDQVKSNFVDFYFSESNKFPDW